MPIYEYRCEPCDHTFETLIRGQGDVAHCPKCGGIDLAKQFSVPAAAQAGGHGPVPPRLRSARAATGACGPGPAARTGMCSFD